MNFVRILIFATVSILSLFFIVNNLNASYSTQDVVEVSGLLNIWASFSGLLIGIYLVIYSVKEQFTLGWRIGEINRILLLSCFVISPVLALGTYSKSQSNIANYVECQNERKISSRYSSRTYALSEEVCMKLWEDNIRL